MAEWARARPSGSEGEARRLSRRLAMESGGYPDDLPVEEQDAWMQHEEVVDALVGMLQTYAGGGRVDKPALDEVRRLAGELVARGETVDDAIAFLAGTFDGGASR